MSQRIFWLGMHKILVQTELPRLRALGYEVFNPPYLSSVKDQSASLDWDSNQFTTLPLEIFEKLSRYNFFYNYISLEIANILNAYFDAIIVTISPAWLVEVLKCYKGKVIYRVYGQHYLIGQELFNNKLIHTIVDRDNFWFVPHAAEAVRDEDSWLREREEIVPYCLPSDVFQLQDSWGHTEQRQPKIALTCPNISNAYFYEHYKFLKRNFSQSCYQYYGVQLDKIKDPRVVGTLPRNELLSSFQHVSGYLYTYTDQRVCYLPPIEMMVLGGPVLYLKGSLLDSYFKSVSPGRCASIEEARKKSKWLIQKDQKFINDIIESQKEVRERYSPDYVWPIFDAVFQKILSDNNTAPAWLKINREKPSRDTHRIYVLHHFPGAPIVSKGGTYSAYDGIPRVVRLVVNILSTRENVEVVVTARSDQVASMNGFFRNHNHRDRIRILCIDPPGIILDSLNDMPGHVVNLIRHVGFISSRIVKRIGKAVIPVRYHFYAKYLLAKMNTVTLSIRQNLRKLLKKNHWYVDLINNDRDCSSVFVPHYYLFPEALNLSKTTILYLPDYMPHFFHDTGEFVLDEGVHTTIGRKLAQKAEKIFCNSYFTKSYLPDSRLKTSSDKIHVSYLPCLNLRSKVTELHEHEIKDVIRDKKYIFYPTQPRPNKNLSFLIRILNALVSEGVDIHLILTASLKSDSKAYGVYQSSPYQKRVVFLNSITDETLAYLYRNAALLCFTSLAEGNFPPQIHEALLYETPIVAGRLGFITERIPQNLRDSLILCEPNNEREFVEGCKTAIENRTEVVSKQKELLKSIQSEDVESSFRDTVLQIFNL